MYTLRRVAAFNLRAANLTRVTWLLFSQMPPKNAKKDDEAEQLTRIAIVDDQKCKPKKCTQEYVQ